MRISKINNTSFQAKVQAPKTGSVKRGLKAAGIYAASTIAAFAVLSNCKQQQNNPEAIHEVAPTPAEVVDTTFKSKIAPNGYYVIKKGDNVWNIATSLLKEKKPDTELTGPIIDKETNKILTLNGLSYPSDSCDVVVIKPGDSLCVDWNIRKKEIAKELSKNPDIAKIVMADLIKIY